MSVLMEEIAISKFKATCLAVMERVRKTRKPILVTRFGKPVVQVMPPPPPHQAKRKLGDMADTMQIVGDIVSPAVNAKVWEVLT